MPLNSFKFACKVLRGETGETLKVAYGCIGGLREEVEDAGDVESWSRSKKMQGALYCSAVRCVFFQGNWR